MKWSRRAPAPDDRHGIDLARSEDQLIRALVAMRQRRSLKPAELARRMGVDRSVVTRFEAGGTNPTMGTITRYAGALGAEIHYRVQEQTIPRAEPPEVKYRFEATATATAPGFAAFRSRTSGPGGGFSPWPSDEVR